MALVAWLLIALGLCAPIATTFLTGAAPRSAGYASGRGLLLSVFAIAVAVALTRSMAKERRVRAYFLAAAFILAVNAWSSFNIAQGARIEREVAAARPEINAIMQAAVTEARLIHSRQIALTEVSPAWEPYATTTETIELGDSQIPLRSRFIEMMRRSKSRELDLARTLRGEIEASGIVDALAPDRLISAEHRAHSLEGIGRYRTFIESYVERLAKLSEQADSDIRALGLPRASEEEMIAGRARHTQDNAAAYDQFVQNEHRIIESIEATIRFVETHAATARVAADRLLFADPAVQAEFDAMIAGNDK